MSKVGILISKNAVKNPLALSSICLPPSWAMGKIYLHPNSQVHWCMWYKVWINNFQVAGLFHVMKHKPIHGLAQTCSNSSALAMELLQSCARPSISTTLVIRVCGLICTHKIRITWREIQIFHEWLNYFSEMKSHHNGTKTLQINFKHRQYFQT